MNKKKRGNGNGTIVYEQDRKKYRAMFTTPEGKRISKRFDTKTEASNWIAAIMASVNEQSFVEPNKITLGQWIIEYLETYAKPNVARKTMRDYLYKASLLQPIEHHPLQKLSVTFIQKFLNNANLTDSNKLRVYKFLKQIFTKACDIELIKKNIMLKVEAPKYKQQEIETFTADEIIKLLAWIKTSDRHQRYYPLIFFAACSGCRIGEVLGLKINNVFENCVKIDNNLQDYNGLYDTTPKTDSGIRTITLPEEVITSLKEAYASIDNAQPNGYVFHSANGTPLKPSNVERMWRRILQLAGLPHRHFHALRHTHATELLAKGVPMLEVSRRLGHSDPTITLKLYGHVIKGYDEKISAEVSNIFLK